MDPPYREMASKRTFSTLTSKEYVTYITSVNSIKFKPKEKVILRMTRLILRKIDLNIQELNKL